MNKILLFACILFCAPQLCAQPWMPANTTSPVKYSDVLKNFRASVYNTGDDEIHNGRHDEEQEGAMQLFKKWDWYWRGHLDQNGYMVPPSRTRLEWQKSLSTQNERSTATTADVPANWVFAGPDICDHGYSGLGRINVVAFDPVDSNTFYVGAAAGSTWKTTDGGNTWSPLYNNWPTLGVADIKINPLNRNTIFVATGDGDAGDAYSSGVIVSHDGGTTWSTTGLDWLATAYITAHSLLINPSDTNSLILATSNGIYKSFNGGSSWVNTYSGDFKQVMYNPLDTNTLYASMYIDTTAQVMRSTDGGYTWSFQTTFPRAQRVCIAITPAAPNIVMAVVSNQQSALQGIYTSTDSGATFSNTFIDDDTCGENLIGYDLGLPTSNCDGQGWYDLCLAISPTNASNVVVGGINTYYSSDSGHSWQICNQWWGGLSTVNTVHADKHCLAYNPLSGGLYETCDGGVYSNYGPLTAPWTDLTDGITITEFYRVAVDNNSPFVIGGAQDNGTKMVDMSGTADLTGGDGMEPLFNYGDPANIWYTSFPDGSVDMTRDGGLNYNSITDTIHSSGAWVTPYCLDPTDTGTLIIGYNQIFKTTNGGLSWSAISPVFDSNADITTLTYAPSNPNYIYASYFDYDVWQPFIRYTNNYGTTWDTLTPPTSSYISDIVIDPKDEQKLWITVSAYGVAKVLGYNGHTNSWADYTYNLPDIPVQCLVIDTTYLTMYVGTDAAVYYRDSSMPSWHIYNTNLPSVQVDDLHINYATNQLWGATFGRGMWVSGKAQNEPNVGVTGSVSQSAAINIIPNPNNGEFIIRGASSIFSNQPAEITMIAVDGSIVFESKTMFDANNNIKLSVSWLSAGIYFCEVNSAGQVSRRKVVVY